MSHSVRAFPTRANRCICSFAAVSEAVTGASAFARINA